MRAVAAKSNSKAASTKSRALVNRKHTPQPPNVYTSPGSIPLIQRKHFCTCDGGCPRCTGVIQTKQSSNKSPPVTVKLQNQIQSLKGGGQPLSQSTRAFFEPRFGMDFGDVRVHTGAKAAEAAKLINAKAFTTGKDVVFGAGQYSTGASTGRRLLAHELMHVVQQDNNVRYNKIKKSSSGQTLNTPITPHRSGKRRLVSHGVMRQAVSNHTDSLIQRRCLRMNPPPPPSPRRPMPSRCRNAKIFIKVRLPWVGGIYLDDRGNRVSRNNWRRARARARRSRCEATAVFNNIKIPLFPKRTIAADVIPYIIYINRGRSCCSYFGGKLSWSLIIEYIIRRGGYVRSYYKVVQGSMTRRRTGNKCCRVNIVKFFDEKYRSRNIDIIGKGALQFMGDTYS